MALNVGKKDDDFQSFEGFSVLCQILYLLIQGEEFTPEETTEVFFGITKLLQSSRLSIRQLVYTLIKDLHPPTSEALVVISSLIKDLSSNTPFFRAHAIDTLGQILDVELLPQVSRLFKESILDQDPSIAKKALVASLRLFSIAPEIVKQWTNETQEALASNNRLLTYHEHLEWIVKKLIIKCSLQAAKVMAGFEGVHQILKYNIRDATLIRSAITFLHSFLLQSNGVIRRFAAVRAIEKLSHTQPDALWMVNVTLEGSINDPNRGIATLAITTLLKTGQDNTIDRLVQSILGFIRVLCMKFPSKHETLLKFLASLLREGSSYDVVDSIITIMKKIPESKEIALEQLAEFIEDCMLSHAMKLVMEFIHYLHPSFLLLLGEHSNILMRTMHLICIEAPQTSNPAKYFRPIFNRVILENEVVRAAAITSLVNYAILYPKVLGDVIVILKRCAFDNDDEVRDRAALYLDLLTTNSDLTEKILSNTLPDLNALENGLIAYLSQSREEPFDLKAIPKKASQEEKAEIPIVPTITKPLEVKEEVVQVDSDMNRIDELFPEEKFGKLFKKPKPANLTEPDNIFIDVDNSQTEELHQESFVSIEHLEPTHTGHCYLIFKRVEDAFSFHLSSVLKFSSKDSDQEELQLDELSVTVSDFFSSSAKYITTTFRSQWDQLGSDHEVVKKFSLSSKNLQDAVNDVIDQLGLDTSDSKIVPEGSRVFTVNLYGTRIDSIPAFARIGFLLDPKTGITLKIAARSNSLSVSEMITTAIH